MRQLDPQLELNGIFGSDYHHCRMGKFTLVGFGTFSVGTRSQREGHNPRTGEKIQIPASKVVKFKAGKTLSEKVK